VRYLLKSVVLAGVLVITGCGDLDQPSNPQVEGGEVVVSFDKALMKKTLINAGAADENTTVFGYTAYKIPYTTTDEEGNEVAVSGLMVVPTGLPEVVTQQIGLSLVSDDHGTIFANREAPGVIGEKTGAPDGAAVILSALAGFVTLQPDYIGFGDSNDHYHPFVLKKSLANATVDFIAAAKIFAAANEIKLNGQLFLTGYSEGGYAALATLQKIEKEGGPEVAIAAPMSGPYAMNEMAMGVLSQPELTVPSFMANVGYSYAKAYGKVLTDVINEPYASKLETLFDGSLTRSEIDPQLTIQTTGVEGLFNPVVVNDFFTDPNNWFKQAMLENDVHKWAPQTQVKLVHCLGDDVIPFAISQLAEGTMKAYHAADVSLVPVEVALTGDPATPMRLGHAECGKYAYGVAAKIFGAARAAVFHY
jgi:hypothetical protein